MMSVENSAKSAKIEIDQETLVRLFKSHQISAADFRCMDKESKNLIWKVCLKTSASMLQKS